MNPGWEAWARGAAAVALGLGAGGLLARGAERLGGGASRPRAWLPPAAAAIALQLALRGPEPVAVGAGLAATLLVLAAVDAASLRLPDALTLPLAAAGLALGPLAPVSLPDRLIGVAGGFGSLALLEYGYRRLRGRSGLGLGDAKLLAAAGAWLGWRALPGVVLLASAAGLAWAAPRVLARGGRALREPIALGPPLCLAVWVEWSFFSTG